ncbi:hypothetical protein ACHAWF_017280 [Thalassiosira exigua]
MIWHSRSLVARGISRSHRGRPHWICTSHDPIASVSSRPRPSIQLPRYSADVPESRHHSSFLRNTTKSRSSRDNNGRVPVKNRNNQRTDGRSTRLVGEGAARSTTQLFLDAFNSTRNEPTRENSSTPWKDPRELVAAEHALEFWAHRSHVRNNQHPRSGGQKHNQHPRHGGQNHSTMHKRESTLEGDAEMALSLFTALHYFHARDKRVLNNAMYSHIVDALAKSPNLDHVSKADALLRQFITLYIKDYADVNGGTDAMALTEMVQSPSPLPLNGESIDLASAGPPRSPSISLKIPDDIEWNDKDNHHFPNQIRITGVMRGYARQCHPREAEDLLGLMISLCSSGGDKRMFRPNEVGFATVIDAYSRMNDGLNAERVLEFMKHRHFGNGSPITVEKLKKGMVLINAANVVAYNAAISAWARTARQSTADNRMSPSGPSQATIQSSRAAADRAEKLLREMWSEHERWCKLDRHHKNPKNIVLPDVVTYASVISAFAACLDQPYGKDHARELLLELETLAARQFGEGGPIVKGGGRHSDGFRPNATVYNTLVQTYAASGDASAAEAILQSMISKERSVGPYKNVRPNTRTFNIVLNVVSKSGDSDAGIRANEILDRFEKYSSGGHGLIQPDNISYNTVLSAWSQSAKINPVSQSEFKEGAQSSSIVGKDAAFEALKLLKKLEPSPPQEGDTRAQPLCSVEPDVISYNTTIAAFANAAQHCKNGPKLAEKAEAILSRMKYQLGIEPDDYSYNGVLLAWARSSGGLEAAKRAESIFRRMRHPTMISWSTLITAYVHADSAPKAESLLKEMEQNARHQGGASAIIPSIVLYNNVLHAWVESSDKNASKNAEALLNSMENTPSKLPRPGMIAYRLVLTALERSSDPDKAQRAKSVLDRFLHSNQGPTFNAKLREIDILEAYNSVLTACAYTPADAETKHRDDAAKIIVESLKEMNQFPWPDDGGGPNQESYALFMQGCTHLFGANSEEAYMLLKSAFCECSNKGLLNDIIWDKFRKALGAELAQAVVNEMRSARKKGVDSVNIVPERSKYDSCKFEALPEEWSGREG